MGALDDLDFGVNNKANAVIWAVNKRLAISQKSISLNSISSSNSNATSSTTRSAISNPAKRLKKAEKVQVKVPTSTVKTGRQKSEKKRGKTATSDVRERLKVKLCNGDSQSKDKGDSSVTVQSETIIQTQLSAAQEPQMLERPNQPYFVNTQAEFNVRQSSATSNRQPAVVQISQPVYTAGGQQFFLRESGQFTSHPYPVTVVGQPDYLQNYLSATFAQRSLLNHQATLALRLSQKSISSPNGVHFNGGLSNQPTYGLSQSGDHVHSNIKSQIASSQRSASSQGAISSRKATSSQSTASSQANAVTQRMLDQSVGSSLSSFNYQHKLKKAISAPDLNGPSNWKRMNPMPVMNLHTQLHTQQRAQLDRPPPVKMDAHATCLITSPAVLKHHCPCGKNEQHLENPDRVNQILLRFERSGLLWKTFQLIGQEATMEEIESSHHPTYAYRWAAGQGQRMVSKDLVQMSCGEIGFGGIGEEIVWNRHTEQALRSAVGCVIQLAQLVADNQLKNGFAVVRPPGHHAEYDKPNGFCYFNNVAIAAKQLKIKRKLKRILILDIDIHHGNGTQNAFYDDDQVLYLSLHRYDNGFYPGTGAYTECGTERALGKTINISWSGGVEKVHYGDAEYLAAFRTVVLPVIEQWQPEIVLVSCGFNAAEGHSSAFGGYHVTPAMFGWMINELVKRNLKLVIALEGGVHIEALCDCSEQVLKALLGLPLNQLGAASLDKPPNPQAVDTLRKVIAQQGTYWPRLKENESFIQRSHRSYQNERLVVLD